MSYLILFGILLFGNYCKTSSAIALDCTFANVTHTLIGSRYACTARVLFDGSDKVVSVYGSHQSGRGNYNVHSLRIQSQNLAFVPTNIESFFPNIIALNFFTNSITNVNNKHLIPFPNLEYLFLSVNRISTLDSNLFSGLRAMRLISFNSNNIKHIGHDINLPSTGTIDFRLNSCINTQATTAAQITTLKLNLLRNCPPTISQIEDTLESRPNLLTNVNFEVKSLVNQTYTLEQSHLKMDNVVKNHTNFLANVNLEVQSLVNKTDNTDDEVQSLTNVVTDLSYKNVQLETRIALLEAIIENKLDIKLEEDIDNES